MKFLLLVAALLVANVHGATKAVISSWTMTASNTDGQSEAATLLQLNTFPSDISALASGATYMILPKYTSASVAYTVKLNAGQGVTSVSTSFTAKNGSPATSNCAGVSTSDTVTGVSGTCSFALTTFDGSKYAFTLTFSDGTTNTLNLYILRGHITSASLGAGGLSPVSIYPTSSGWNYAQGTNYAPSTVVYTWSYVYGPSNYGTTNTITSNTYWADTWSQTPRIKYTIDGAAKPLVDFGSAQPFTVSSCATPIIVQLYANFADGLPIFTVDYNVNVYTLIITTFQATSALSSGSVLYASSQWNGAKYYAVAGAQVNSNGGPTSAQQCSIALGSTDRYCVQTSVCKSTDFVIKDSFSGLAATPVVSNTNSGTVVCYDPAAGASFTHSIFSTLNSRTDNIEYQCRVTKASSYNLLVQVIGLTSGSVGTANDASSAISLSTNNSPQTYPQKYNSGASFGVSITSQPSADQTCSVTNVQYAASYSTLPATSTTGAFASADVLVTITCTPLYKVCANVRGLLSGASVTVTSNSGALSNTHAFADNSATKCFTSKYYANAASWNVAMATPSNYVCRQYQQNTAATFTSWVKTTTTVTGTIPAADVTVYFECKPLWTYTVNVCGLSVGSTMPVTLNFTAGSPVISGLMTDVNTKTYTGTASGATVVVNTTYTVAGCSSQSWAQFVNSDGTGLYLVEPQTPIKHTCSIVDISGAATKSSIPAKSATSTFADANIVATIVCAPVIVSVGDPHLTGFKGQSYDITGVPGTVYNWYNDVDFQMNCKIDRPAHAPTNATYVTAVGMAFGNTGYLTIVVDPYERTTLHPRKLVKDETGEFYTMDGNCGRIQWVKTAGSDHHDTLSIEWQQYKISLTRRAFWEGARKKFNILNIAIEALPTTTGVHGLLGQSWRMAANANEEDIEGKLEDYEVKDGLLGTQYKYKLYKFQAGQYTDAQCAAGAHRANKGVKANIE